MRLSCSTLMVCCVLFLNLSQLSAEESQKSVLPESESYSEKERTLFDPYAGIDYNGRIPKVDLPDDIKNPARWRYIPEGRIKPGNLFQRFLVSSFIVPIFFHEKDIGTGGGVAITDTDFRQKRRREFAGTFLSYTTEGQQRYSVVWQRWLNHRDLQTGGVTLEERSYLRARLGYERTLTRRFYGLGSDTEQQDETSYTEEVSWLHLYLQRTIPEPGDDIIYQVSVKGEHHNLAGGRVSSKPSTDEIYPDVFDEGDAYYILWLGGVLSYDTRDSQHIPYGGWMIQAGADFTPLQSNGDTAIFFTISSNGILKVPGLFHKGGEGDEEHPPTDTIAIGAQLQWMDGKVPYWALPSLGGRDTLRGYIANRFTGGALWHATAEYRFWVVPRGFKISDEFRVERLGAALFYDRGTVADDLDGLRSAAVHDSYGFSFRFTLDRTALFRADIGFSDEETNFTFAYGLTF